MRVPRPMRLVVLTAAVITGAIAAAPAVLAALPKVDVYPSERCLVGPWPDGTIVRVTLRSSTGVLKQSTQVEADDGQAIACLDKPIRAGDRIRIAADGERRTMVVPRLVLRGVDRVKDTVRGRTTPGRQVRVRIARCGLDDGFNFDLCPVALNRAARGGPDGRFTADLTGGLDLRGRDLIEIVVRSASGDRFLELGKVPVFFISNLGEPWVSGQFPGDAVVDFTLRDGAGGPVVGRAALPSADPLARFRDGAVDVPVQPGHQVVGDFASDAKMLVPTMITAADAAADTVTATCFANQPYLLQVMGTPSVTLEGIADGDGKIALDLTGTLDLTSLHDLNLRCMTRRGDSIDHFFPVS